jgi:uncharacterized membrane protein
MLGIKIRPSAQALTIIGLVVSVGALVVFPMVAGSHRNTADFAGNYAFVKARVDKISYDDTEVLEKRKDIQEAKQEFSITILEGPHKGEIYQIRNTIESIDVHKMIVGENDRILVNYTLDQAGKMDSIHLYEIVRDRYLYVMVGFFVFSLVLICGKKGLKAILTLLFTGFMIIGVLMPIILAGYNTLVFTVAVCIVTAAACIYLINGISTKTMAATIGTVGGVTAAAVVAIFVGTACKVTGLANNDSQMLAYTGKSLMLDYRAILFAAILVGALGRSWM